MNHLYLILPKHVFDAFVCLEMLFEVDIVCMNVIGLSNACNEVCLQDWICRKMVQTVQGTVCST